MMGSQPDQNVIVEEVSFVEEQIVVHESSFVVEEIVVVEEELLTADDRVYFVEETLIEPETEIINTKEIT